LFSWNHLRPPASIQIGDNLLPQVVSFKYLGVFFDAGLRWGAKARYFQKRCQQRLNFLKSIAGVWWSAHPRCIVMLYRGLVGSVLEYGSVCYSGMVRTLMLLLEKVQYRRIRTALRLSHQRHRFVYLNFRYLVTIFFNRLDCPLKRRLETL
jgi:hypothetical protein